MRVYFKHELTTKVARGEIYKSAFYDLCTPKTDVNVNLRGALTQKL